MSTRYESASISTANTNTDGTGTIVDLATGGANGSRIDSIVVKAVGDVTDGMVRFFLWDGAAYDLYYELPIPATDGDALTPYYTATAQLPTSYLSNAKKIGVSTNNAEAFTVFANLTDF